MKQLIIAAKSTQSAIPELNQPEKTLYYLVIGEGDKKISLNVGQKTYDSVVKLNKETAEAEAKANTKTK